MCLRTIKIFFLWFLLWPGAGEAKCLFHRDEIGIPHLKAESDLEVYECLGFLHSQDRIWQLDWFKRMGQGRTAEVAGYRRFKSDFGIRLLQLPQRAQRIFDELKPETKRILKAYAKGIRKGHRERDSYEFEELGYGPDLWEEKDSILITLALSFSHSRMGISGELKNSPSPSVALPPWHTTIIKKEESLNRSDPSQRSSFRNWDSSVPQVESVGSNSWVVGRTRSKSGIPILANDPHLKLNYPSYLYWVHLQGKTFNAIGATVPGIPAILAGANETVSWGITTSYFDTADLVEVEEKNLSSYWPLIWIRFLGIEWPFKFKKIEKTSEGLPILPVKIPEKESKVALLWSGLSLKGEDFDAIFQILKSKNVSHLNQTLAQVGVPSWNFVMADSRGKIAMRTVGKLFQRAHPKETLEDPPKFLNSKEMPHLFAPKREYIVAANNQHWPIGSPFSGGHAYASSLRAFRIENLLLSQKKHSVQSFRRLQCDTHSTEAEFLTPLLVKALQNKGDQSIREVMNQFSAWDYNFHLDCKQCALYRLWVDELFKRLDLDEASLYFRLKSPDSVLVQVLLETLGLWIKKLKEEFESAFPFYRDAHVAQFPHFFGGKRFERNEGISTPGDKRSVSLGQGKWNEEKKRLLHRHGAVLRMVVEMSHPPEVFAIVGGESKDQRFPKISASQSPWKKWANCELERQKFPLKWNEVKTEEISFAATKK